MSPQGQGFETGKGDGGKKKICIPVRKKEKNTLKGKLQSGGITKAGAQKGKEKIGRTF